MLWRLVDPACATMPSSPASYAAVDSAPLRVCRLEDRRVLAADVLGGTANLSSTDVAALAGGVSTLSQPSITAPANQSTTEGASLVFSPAAGREIRIDAPGLGAGQLRVDISAFESLGQVTPILSFGSTAGLTVTGNGVNVFQLQGTLTNINAALASLTFYSPDNGDFTIALAATDPSSGENASASVDIDVLNVAPQVSLQFGSGAEEGSNLEVPLQLFDPGAVDNPQVSWSVSRQNVVIANGAGSQVQFFAANDGVYELTVTAFDKDGGTTSQTQDIFVRNQEPLFELTGSMQGDFVDLHVVITDRGHELFTVQIYWTDETTTAEIFVTQDRILTFSHRYTPEEIDNELTIVVQVIDDHASVRQSLQFREGEPTSAERPEFSSRPQESPPERTVPSRVQPAGTSSQIVSADFDRAVTQGTQATPALHQFVLRVVSPDGKESESYQLPGGALADLPEFLNSLGVPDGHYRVYLITGELERLVIDGHLRAGRIVDPTDESPSGFDSPRGDVAAVTGMDPGRAIEALSAALPPMYTGRGSGSMVGESLSAENKHDNIDCEQTARTATVRIVSSEPLILPLPADPVELDDTAVTSSSENDDIASNLGILGGTLVVCAAATAIYATARQRNKPAPASPRFNKQARLARKLARARSTIARFRPAANSAPNS